MKKTISAQAEARLWEASGKTVCCRLHVLCWCGELLMSASISMSHFPLNFNALCLLNKYRFSSKLKKTCWEPMITYLKYISLVILYDINAALLCILCKRTQIKLTWWNKMKLTLFSHFLRLEHQSSQDNCIISILVK